MSKRILTDVGRSELENLLKNLKNLLDDRNKIKNGYPFQTTILGYGKWRIDSRNELFGKIEMLENLINIDKQRGD